MQPKCNDRRTECSGSTWPSKPIAERGVESAQEGQPAGDVALQCTSLWGKQWETQTNEGSTPVPCSGIRMLVFVSLLSSIHTEMAGSLFCFILLWSPGSSHSDLLAWNRC